MNSQMLDFIEGYGPVKPFAGAFANIGQVTRAPVQVWSARPGAAKVLPRVCQGSVRVQELDLAVSVRGCSSTRRGTHRGRC